MISEKLLNQAKNAESPEKILELARENGLGISGERAQELYNSWHCEGAISDDELDNVSGGCGISKEHCPSCKSTNVTVEQPKGNTPVAMFTYTCKDCGHSWKSAAGKY